MKTPKEIIQYRNSVIDLFQWAVSQGHITEEQAEILKTNLYEIECDMYPKAMMKDENGWPHPVSEYIYGLSIDDWE